MLSKSKEGALEKRGVGTPAGKWIKGTRWSLLKSPAKQTIDQLARSPWIPVQLRAASAGNPQILAHFTRPRKAEGQNN